MVYYKDHKAWLADCRRTVRDDYDNVLLYTGPEGEGKSTIMAQHMMKLDPSFNINRIAPSLPDFLRIAPNTPQFCAVVADEALINKRKSMWKTNIDLLDFLQRCRGLNLHIGLCFPHEELLDQAVLNHRVRWNVHVPRRGEWWIRQRVRFFRPGRPDMPERFGWRVCGKFTFEQNSQSHPLWAAYRKMKDEAMRAGGEDPAQIVEPESPTARWDPYVAELRRLMNDEPATASISGIA